MRLGLLALLYTAAQSVQADPVTVSAVGGWLTTVAFAGITYGQILLAVGMTVYGAAQQRKAQREAEEASARARDAYLAGLRDRQITSVSTELPHRLIYGRDKVGVNVVAMFSAGPNEELKYLVAVVAPHECDAIEEIYVAGKALGPLDAQGRVTSGYYYKTSSAYHTSGWLNTLTFPLPEGADTSSVIVTDSAMTQLGYTISGGNVIADAGTGPYFMECRYTRNDSAIRVKVHLGADVNEAADAMLMGAVPSKWTPQHTLPGYTYLAIELSLVQPEFQSGIPSIQVVARGKKLYNFRTGTTAWSQNPAEVLYDYLTGPLNNIPAMDLPVATDYVTAANVCDEAAVNLGGQARYTFNGTVDADQDPSAVVEKIANAMCGSVVATTWATYAGKYIAPVLDLTQDDIVGEVTVNPGIAGSALFNGIRGKFISPENEYVATDFKAYQNAAYLSADGGPLWKDLDLPYTNTLQRVHNICRIITEDQRNGYSVKGLFSHKAARLRVGDRCTWTAPLFGISSPKIFRVTDKNYSPGSMVDLTLKEDAASIWDEADAVTADPATSSDFPDPFDIQPLGRLTATSGTAELQTLGDGTIISRVHLFFPAVTTPGVFTSGRIEFQWKALGDEAWQSMTVPGNVTEAYLAPVSDGQVLAIRGRTVNSTLNIYSDWTYADLHTVIGKTEAPPDITNLAISGTRLTCDEITAKDLRGYLFRFHYGTNLDWNSAAPLHKGLVTNLPFDLVTAPGGTVTIMAKAIDTSGNESAAAGYVIANLGDAPIANVVQVYDLAAEGFPGTYVNGTLVGGALEAVALDSFYGTDNQSAYGLDSDSAYKASSYAQLQYITREISTLGALAGSKLTLEISSQGTDLQVEYRLAAPGPAYEVDADPAYGADADSFFSPPGAWTPWPGQIETQPEAYQFRVTIGAGATQGAVLALALTVDAPDMVEYLADVPISAGGTVIPYQQAFTVIQAVTAQLQPGASGAVRIEVDKTSVLAPVIKAYNSSNIAVNGASADIILKGY